MEEDKPKGVAAMNAIAEKKAVHEGDVTRQKESDEELHKRDLLRGQQSRSTARVGLRRYGPENRKGIKDSVFW